MSNNMRTRKTPTAKRDKYIYYDDFDGHKIIIEEGKDGVTKESIKELHKIDDSEVHINLKELHCESKHCAKVRKEKLKAKGYKYESTGFSLCSLDNLEEDNGYFHGDRLFKSISSPFMDENESESTDRLWEIIYSFSEEDRKVFILSFLEGYSGKEIADMFDISPAMVSYKVTKIKKAIFNDSELRSLLRFED